MVDRTAAMLEAVFAGLTPRETGQLHELAQRWLGALTLAPSREEAQT